MPEIDDLRDRLHQLESIVFELPNLMNMRLDGIESHIRSFRLTLDNTGARLGQVEKVMGLVQADMRDLRNGVTLQLRLQGEQLQSFDATLKSQVERLGRVEERLNRVEQRLDSLEQRFERFEQRVEQSLEVQEQGLKRVEHVMESRLGSIDRALQAVAAKLSVGL